MSHHSKHHVVTQYISLRGMAVNEFYRTILSNYLYRIMIQMGEAGHFRGNQTEADE